MKPNAYRTLAVVVCASAAIGALGVGGASAATAPSNNSKQATTTIVGSDATANKVMLKISNNTNQDLVLRDDLSSTSLKMKVFDADTSTTGLPGVIPSATTVTVGINPEEIVGDCGGDYPDDCLPNRLTGTAIIAYQVRDLGTPPITFKVGLWGDFGQELRLYKLDPTESTSNQLIGTTTWDGVDNIYGTGHFDKPLFWYAYPR